MEKTLFSEPPLKLNLGCGNGAKHCPDFINIDIKPLPLVNLVWDISKGLPLANDTVIYITAHDFLEHVDNLKFVLQEMYRVSSHGAIWDVRVPYWANTTAFNTLSHQNFFSENTFSYFHPNHRKEMESGWYEWGWDIWLECLEQHFNYHSSAIKDIGPQGSSELEHAKTYMINIVDTMAVKLRVVKKFDD